MARTFDLPISWFFVPPDPGEGPERLDSGTAGGLTWEQLVVLLVGHGGNYTAFADRLGHRADTAWRGTTMPFADRLPDRSAVAGEGFRQAVTADDVALAAFMGAIRLQFGGSARTRCAYSPERASRTKASCSPNPTAI